LTNPIVDVESMVGAEEPAGNLLADLERRQDDVLAQLDDLDRRVSDLLRGLGVTLIEDSEAIHFVDDADEDGEGGGSVKAALTPPRPVVLQMAGQSQQDDWEQGDQGVVGDRTDGFSKLPSGEAKANSRERTAATSSQTERWKQRNRAA
jgi:hypothetical protein